VERQLKLKSKCKGIRKGVFFNSHSTLPAGELKDPPSCFMCSSKFSFHVERFFIFKLLRIRHRKSLFEIQTSPLQLGWLPDYG
jgi:hypothetical protein